MNFPALSWLVLSNNLFLIAVASVLAERQHVSHIPVDKQVNPRLRHLRDKQCPDGFQGRNCKQGIDECKSSVYPCTSGNKRGSFCIDYDPPQKFKCGCLPGYDAVLPNADNVHDNVTIDWRPLKCLPKDACVEFVCHKDAKCIVSANNTAVCICMNNLVGDGITNCKPPKKIGIKKPQPRSPLSCRMDSDCHKFKNSGCVMGVCECKAGFYRNNKGQCIMENKCTDGYPNDCHKNAMCRNTKGGYTCTCKDGYHDLDPIDKPGTMCAQTNECLVPSMNDCNSKTQDCIDLPPPSKWQCVVRTPSPTIAPVPPPITVCPESEEAFALACSPRLADVTCTYGQICCEGNGKCIPERSCDCDGFTGSCGNADDSLVCPSVCPKEPLQLWKFCDIDYRYLCNYGDPVVCDDPNDSFDFEAQCHCSGGDFSCIHASACPVSCPVTPPVHGDSCSVSFVGWFCRYGDPFVCDSGESFEYEKECYCSGSEIYCDSNVCPVPCPAIMPDYGDACSAAFATSTYCDYGKLCCGAETDGACITDKTCYCDGSFSTYCNDKEGILPCPSVCPKERPHTGDACDIDYRYQCNYGDPITCDDPTYSSNSELQCHCNSGNFTCNVNVCPLPCPVTPPISGTNCSAPFVGGYCGFGNQVYCDLGETFEYETECSCSDGAIVCHSNECPVPCPVTRPVHGDSCSASFVNWSCRYGDPFVCDSGDSFEYVNECSCSDGKVYCDSNQCPVPCPAIEPNDGDACSASFINSNQCNYGKLCCGDETTGACIPDKACFCTGTQTYCDVLYDTLPCPSVCPTERPHTGDACDIDFRYQCNYGGPVVCDNPIYASHFELQCQCEGGKFLCSRSKACPVPCPATPVAHGDSCSAEFADGYCQYGGPVVCDSGESLEYERACYCSEDQIYCNSNVCPVACPVTKPNDGDACSTPFINSNHCDYGKLCCGAETDAACITDKICSCDGSKTQCNDNDITLPCQSVCPKEAPLPYAACDIDYRYQCNYGDPIICDNPNYSSDHELQCHCSDGNFICSVNVCPLPCPVTPPVPGTVCMAPFVDGYCKYGDPFVCDWGERFEYEQACYCYSHEILCYHNVCRYDDDCCGGEGSKKLFR